MLPLARIAESLAETEEAQIWKVDAQCVDYKGISRLTAESAGTRVLAPLSILHPLVPLHAVR